MPNSWLDLIVSSTQELEPPERFFWWAGLAVISAIVKKNVFINRFSYILYPNIYVILVSAKSGLRKGIPMSYARGILNKINCTRIITGQNSLPAVLHDLSQQFTTPDGKVFSDAQVLLCAPELDSFLVKGDDSLTTLTDLHNTHEHEDGYRKNLRSGTIELKNPCVTLLGASNEKLLDDFMQEKDIEGGFLARTFIVHESKRRRNNSLMWEPKGLVTRGDLARAIERVVNLSGVFEIPEEGRRFYDEWYNEISSLDFEDRTGSLERIGDQVLKVAMLISLAEDNVLVLEKRHLEIAIQVCEDTLIGVKKVSSGQGRSDITPIVGHILKILVDSPDQECERAKLLERTQCEPIQLDRAIDTLVQRDAIKQYRKQGARNKIFYQLTPETYAKYLQIRGGKP